MEPKKRVDRRMEVRNMLLPICENLYFSPPTGKQLTYPCIIYKQEPPSIISADNRDYIMKDRYSLTIIDEDPDSELVDQIEQLQYCRQDGTSTVEGLNHWYFTLFH